MSEPTRSALRLALSTRPRPSPFALLALVLIGTACSSGTSDPCALEDEDGIIGGEAVFVLRITDDGFDPPTLAEQNQADVTLTLENESTSEAGFEVDCMPTPNDDGCAQESCFPEASTIEPIAPGESATVEFQLPEVEGKYIYRSLPDGDRTGEFVLR